MKKQNTFNVQGSISIMASDARGTRCLIREKQLSVRMEMQRQPWFSEIKAPQCEVAEEKVSDTECVCVCVLSSDEMCAWERNTIKGIVGSHTSFLQPQDGPVASWQLLLFQKW